MKKIKVSEATENQLEWLVASIEYPNDTGVKEFSYYTPGDYTFCSDWGESGPIIERREIELHKWGLDGWVAKDTNYQFLDTPQERGVFAEAHGPTPLIAAMRCYVASRFGDEAEVPDELA